MCGIFGVTNHTDEASALKALKSFAYRGPDHTGYVMEKGVFLGNNRLSIIDLDERSNQPQFSADKRISIVFNGEIFNFRQLKMTLSSLGHIFKTESDTEVLLHLYEQYGESFVTMLRGMFAIALFDKPKNKIVLLRDHAGIKPLYYTTKGGRFIFSSELKGITAIEKDLRLSRYSFTLASGLGYIPSPYTLYEEVYKLPAGASLTYDLSSQALEVKRDSFINAESEIRDPNALAELVEEKVLSHLVGDVPVGLFFSGGTDSSLIAAILKKHNISLKTYSIIMGNKPEDAEYIEKIGKHLDLNMHKAVFGVEEFDAALKVVKGKLDEPTLDSSLLALYHISKIASQEVKVVLSGEGADEFFFGYPRARALVDMGSGKRSLAFLDPLYNSNIPFKGKRRIFLMLYKYFGDPYSYYLAATTDRLNTLGWAQWRELFRENRFKPLELDQHYYLENDLLRKMDLATSYTSIEGRVPFLDADIISASRNFCLDFKNGTMLKPVLKKMLTQYLPSELVYRGKSGLGLQVRKIFKVSTIFKNDFEAALVFLRAQEEFRGLVPDTQSDKLALESPYYSFLLLTYYYAIKNTV